MCKTRIECLKELIECVFDKKNTAINHRGKTIYSESNNNLIKNCKFKSTKSMNTYYNHFETIFRLTLMDDKVKFKIAKEDYNKSDAINNIFNYLTSKGVDFSKLGDYSFNDPEFVKILFEAIKKYILGAIFILNHNRFEKPSENDNIEIEFSDAIFYINAMLSEKNFVGYGSESINNLILIWDYGSKDYNYAIPLQNLKIYDLNKLSHKMFFGEIIAYAEIIVHKKVPKNLYKSFFEELTCEFKIFNSTDKVIYGKPFFGNPNNNSSTIMKSKEFHISDNPIPSPDVFMPKYYITYLDEQTIKLYYPKVKTSDELKNAMYSKIKMAYESYCNKMIPVYYRNLKLYIEDVLNKIISMNLNAFLHCDPNDINKHKKNLEILNIDPEHIFNFLSLIDDEKERFFQYYRIIERVISQFCDNLNKKVELSQEMLEYLDIAEYKEHIENIEKIYKSQKLSRAIKIQNDLVKSKSELYSYGIKSPYFDEKKYRCPTLFVDLKISLQEYCKCLKDTLDKTTARSPRGASNKV